jgi:hypothetical protein
MLKITLAALGIYLSTLAGFSQVTPDSSLYKNRKLKFEEANFVSSYYHQEGNNSAVTGGIGTEKLTDFATTIDVKFSRYDYRKRKHTFAGELGVDVYSSASSDKIDPNTISSASSGDVRVYPSLTWAMTDEQKGSTLSVNGSFSGEYDYYSVGGSLGWTKLSKDRNREVGVKAQVFFDTWSVIYPVELRSPSNPDREPRNSYSTSFTLSQVITKRLQMLLIADLAYQEGLLGTLYHRTYFTDGSHKVENLPGTRFKIPIGIRANYFMGDRFIFRTFYRYYQDSWELSAHTAELETTVKITPFFSVSPFYRYYTQKGVKYFAGYEQHDLAEEFYTSDYDLSTLTSNMLGLGLRYAPPGGLMGVTKLNAAEIRYGHYDRSTGLNSNIISLMLKLK